MSFSIAVAGKGGSGKTSIASLVIRYLKNNGKSPILAVDADPNDNLAQSLGLEVKKTIGSVLGEFQGEKIGIPPGMTKEAYLEFKFNTAIVENKGFDLIAMGRGEGAECYCYPNLMLRKFTDTLSSNYTYTVLDNEAGMEHLSRRTTQNVDVLLIISNNSVKGARTVGQIIKLVKELKLSVAKQAVVVNLATDGKIDPLVTKELTRLNIEPAAIIPLDEEMRDYDIQLKSLLELPDSSLAAQAVTNLMTKLIS